MHSEGFEPIAASTARVLILGTLPGQVSLKQHQYYALPRNGFWRIMGDLFGASPDLPYSVRTARLIENGVALWDVCRAAYRPGSLDNSIRDAVPNNFLAYFNAHPQVKLICFNGSKAAELYQRHVFPLLPLLMQQLRRQTLPSTSPANAAMSFTQKLSHWSIVRNENGA
jgi:hypoxanthine-DNA glycosylase